MKLVKIRAGHQCKLWEFIKANLPSGLTAEIESASYGTIYLVVVYQGENKKNFWGNNSAPKIAAIRDDEVELYAPEYSSDFMDIINKYEEATGRANAITLKFWES